MRLRGLLAALVLALGIFGVTSLSGERDGTATAQVPPQVIGSISGTTYEISFGGVSSAFICMDLYDNFTMQFGGTYFGYPGIAGTFSTPAGPRRGFWIGSFVFMTASGASGTHLGYGTSSLSGCTP